MKLDLETWVREQSWADDQQRRLSNRIYETAIACSPHIESGNFENMTDRDLRFLFDAIDELFFEGLIRNYAAQHRFPIEFRISKRMTNAGGTTRMSLPGGQLNQKHFEIAVSAPLLFHSFREGSGKATVVTGIPCRDRLEGLQRIMEHEMIHLIEMMLWHDSSCSARRFRNIAARFFGHRQSNHQLLRPRDVARRDHGINIGDWVFFIHRGQAKKGRVNRITRRATILVPDAAGTRYNDGTRYAKYYVPYDKLTKADAD